MCKKSHKLSLAQRISGKMLQLSSLLMFRSLLCDSTTLLPNVVVATSIFRCVRNSMYPVINWSGAFEWIKRIASASSERRLITWLSCTMPNQLHEKTSTNIGNLSIHFFYKDLTRQMSAVWFHTICWRLLCCKNHLIVVISIANAHIDLEFCAITALLIMNKAQTIVVGILKL